MIIDGVYRPNITCLQCKQRHPADISCADAKAYAEHGYASRAMRQSIEAIAEVSDAQINELTLALAAMLFDRASRGNAQSKHGQDAAYSWEVFNFVIWLDLKLGANHR
jgi:hypothetical protein